MERRTKKTETKMMGAKRRATKGSGSANGNGKHLKAKARNMRRPTSLSPAHTNPGP